LGLATSNDAEVDIGKRLILVAPSILGACMISSAFVIKLEIAFEIYQTKCDIPYP
jgi:hypothetical protein